MNQPIEPLRFDTAATEAGRARPHESAHLHVAGTAPYIDDLPELAGTLHAALGLSPVAHGLLKHIDVERIKAMPGVVAVLTAADIPAVNDCGPIVHDEPILATDKVHYLGQAVFAVIATDRDLARRAAAQAESVLTIEPLPPVLNALDAHAKQQHAIPSMHLVRESQPGAVRAALAAAPHRLQGTLSVGGQEQFYLEGQIAYACPAENAGLVVHSSTQHPTEMQHAIAHALGWRSHQVQVLCRRMGGGFGGKESQSAVFACVASIAAAKLGRPVKLRVDRDDDFLITGRRHGFDHAWEVGFDDQGRVLAAEITMVSNAGWSADLSAPVMARALCHFDNAYWLPEVAMHGHGARTNTQSNTAFRGFGGPQGAIAIEVILDSIARRLGKDALDVRRANFYGTTSKNVTPYLQTIDDNVIAPLVDELVATSDYAARREAIAAFNAASPVLKKGLALTPVKFGISFNVRHYNQAGALVHIYTDGSVLVNHGGTEMGQGLNTKVAQVVATELGIAFERVRVSATDTHKIANTSATAASTGSDLNGKAAQDAARQLRQRLTTLAARVLGGSPDQVRLRDGKIVVGQDHIAFEKLVALAYAERVQLWSDGFYATPGLHWDREKLQGRPFFYFAYGAAVTEVIVDTLTGEHRLLRADLLHDVGRSLNPAIDIGQIEGAFIQGMGWLTMEELVWHPTTGKLTTHAPSTYKIPTANDCPRIFTTRLYDNANVEDSIHRSKAVGEPPLLLAFSVFLAIRDAVSAVGGHRVDPPLRAPATPEAVLDAIDAVSSSSPASAGEGRGEGLFRMNAAALRAQATAWLAAGRAAIVVEVLRSRGSVPRETGTRMLVDEDAVLGTIGGGHLEWQAIDVARAQLRECAGALARLAPHEQRRALGPTLGQCCGGELTLRYAPLDADALAAWPEPAPRFHLQLHGAGHVGRAIVALLAGIDCRVQWIDEREAEFAEADLAALPPHIEASCVDAVEAEVANAPRGACFLVMTHEHALDLRIVEAVLKRDDFEWCGLIGSKTKRMRFERRLEERGVARSAIDRLVCPIGLPGIAGKEPEVLAVAVVAQLLHLRS